MNTERGIPSARSPLGPILVAVAAGGAILILLSWPLFSASVAPSLEDVLPLLNTSLILMSGACLVLGRHFIAQGCVIHHKRSMITAAVFAALFLIVYVTRWATFGTKAFTEQGWLRPFYLTILTSHTLLAIAIVPLVLIALRRALKREFLKHRRIARWTFPFWLYVVLTGWVIYWMLYRL